MRRRASRVIRPTKRARPIAIETRIWILLHLAVYDQAPRRRPGSRRTRRRSRRGQQDHNHQTHSKKTRAAHHPRSLPKRFLRPRLSSLSLSLSLTHTHTLPSPTRTGHGIGENPDQQPTPAGGRTRPSAIRGVRDDSTRAVADRGLVVGPNANDLASITPTPWVASSDLQLSRNRVSAAADAKTPP